ncbi:hypothetical protein VD0002_g2448 [Verticillium dahliae]|uniref:DUF1275 domain-containing protein n=2 Tax=Verticillium dahliae TaxID=27337 RepID=G2WX07_VERDV|nr:uncharacterized protein VDAG_02786 [Verticillium dahliae VdLs.17]KAF3351248.1 Putative voltage-gated potassium channel subunit beta [Verticillium dahliae VDG2]KAH6707252.1 hypothetical protein EV126DRAFT_157627 [Verticillium dahliae]EGY21262.1 hypothetical protein VDAG_02786 [Verticillium dahliae VdLs.17]PNH30358.1 hypothetical protein BJF96_g6305 [Verticillium dahliae]PNH42981.1 hypothetical protein VD0004_g4396 [Verticillium dahliae]
MSLENGLQVAPNHGAGAAEDSDATTQELPHHVAQQQPPRKTWLEWLRDDVHVNHTDLPLFACCFISGLCDSVTVNASNVFVSMQTGNTIFLALGAASLPYGDPYRWLRSLVSIGSFALGCFTFAHTRHFQPKRKATLALSFLVQAAAIWIAAILAQTGVVADYNRRNVPSFNDDLGAATQSHHSHIVLLPVALIAWQFGGQIVSSRVLGYNEVPTCVLTSVYCDLLSDPKILAPLKENPKRNRRFLAILLLLLGGIVSGWIQRSAAGTTTVLWIAGFIKVVIAACWLAWPSKTLEPKSEK